MIAVSAADVIFDPVQHHYSLPDGQRVPGVTEILASVGVSTDFEALAGMSERIGAAIDLKRHLGQALHADAHAHDDDDLDWDTVDPRVEPYLRAWVTFRENTGLAPVLRERLVFHPTYVYAGTTDGVFADPQGRHVLVDLKTGDPDDAGCAFQTAAYKAALEEQRTIAITERWGVQLLPELKVPYRICRYTDWRDWGRFQAFLTTYHCQAVRRRRTA